MRRLNVASRTLLGKCQLNGGLLTAEVFHPAGANTSNLIASGRLHASNTIALSSLSPGAYQISLVCSSIYCLPEPAELNFHTEMALPNSLQLAAGTGIASEDAGFVHVLRPSVTVRHMQYQGQDKNMAQHSRAPGLAKGFWQGWLLLILLCTQGISLASIQRCEG